MTGAFLPRLLGIWPCFYARRDEIFNREAEKKSVRVNTILDRNRNVNLRLPPVLFHEIICRFSREIIWSEQNLRRT